MQHILSCSLGKDSIATLVKILQQDYPLDRIVWADIPGAEFEETYSFIEHVERVLGIKIERVHSEKWETWDALYYSKKVKGELKGKCQGFPPVAGRGCSYKREFKVIPLDKACGTGNCVYVGIAADEAHRSEAKRYKESKNSFFFPLLDLKLTESDCIDICRKYDLLHPLYGCFRRLGCWQCPKQGIASLRNLYAYWPENGPSLSNTNKIVLGHFTHSTVWRI